MYGAWKSMKKYKVSTIVYIENDEYSANDIVEHFMKFGIPRPERRADLKVEAIQ